MAKMTNRKAELEWDFEANAGYVRLQEIKPGGVSISREANDAEVILDFDKNGKLVGFELIHLDIKESEWQE